MKAFPFRWDFFTFLQGSLNPQIYELAPQISEINSHSPQIPKTPGGPMIVSGAYLLYYLRCESQIWCNDASLDGDMSQTIFRSLWPWTMT